MIRRILRVLFLAVALGCTVVPAQSAPVGSGFTYQGQLKQGGQPFNGTAKLVFRLFAETEGGSPLGTQVLGDTSVTNGLFTVELNGKGEFSGSAFDGDQRWLEVEVDGTVLTPRQRVTAVPFAQSVPGLATTDTGLEVAGDVHTTGDVIASAFSSNSPLIFKVNPGDVECARFDDANCYFGLGTTAPQARLHIGGVAGIDGIRFPDGSLQTSAAGIGGGDGFWNTGSGNIFNNNGGNVGIGTTDPHHRLRISGGPFWTTNGWLGSLELDNASALGWRTNAAGQRFGIGQSGGGLYFFRTASDPGTATGAANYDLVIGDSGNVGIGTTSPQAKLHITYSDSVSHRIEAGGGTNAWSRVEFVNGNGQWDIGTSRSFNNDMLYLDRRGNTSLEFQFSTGGNLGLGIEPQAKLHMFGSDSVSHRIHSGGGTNAWSRVEFLNGDGQWDIGTSRNFNGNQLYFYRSGSPGIAFGVQPNGDAFLQGTMSCNALRANGADVQGTMSCKVLAVSGADVAEKFPSSDDQVEPGTVMEIDPDHTGKLRIAREAYSSRVAGVVSGAGDIAAGTVLGNTPGSEDSPAIALSGRVWVRCDASSAEILRGDFLTTSATPGHAMKASDRGRSQGAILGKAMSTLAHGERGLVLVLVNLQ